MRELELELVREFLRSHPREAAAELEALDPSERAALLADEPPEEAAAVFRLLSPAAGADALRDMELRSSVALLCRLPAGVAAQRVMRLAWSGQEALVAAVPDPWRAPLRQATLAPAGSVGALMDRRPTALPETLSAERAIAALQKRPSSMRCDLFVIDSDGKLTGRSDLTALYSAPSLQPLAGFTHPNPDRIAARSPAVALLDDRLWTRHEVLPVVDGSGRLVGSLSHRQLRAVAAGERAEEATVAIGVADATELLWTGCMAALDVVAAVMLRAGTPPPAKESADGA